MFILFSSDTSIETWQNQVLIQSYLEFEYRLKQIIIIIIIIIIITSETGKQYYNY